MPENRVTFDRVVVRRPSSVVVVKIFCSFVVSIPERCYARLVTSALGSSAFGLDALGIIVL